MAYVKVNADCQIWSIGGEDPDDEWSRDSTDGSVTVLSISEVDEKDYHDICVPFDVVPGKDYYLVWAQYTTGDSFGYDGGWSEFVDLFQTEEKAESARVCLDDVSCQTYLRDDGTEIHIYRPWAGYFESLDRLEIETVRLED